MAEYDPTKKPYQKTEYSQEQFEDLMRCVDDPIHFMAKHVMVTHPTKGAIPFDPYPFQLKIIKAFVENRFSIIMTGRQQGKSFYRHTTINIDGKPTLFSTLMKFNIRERTVNWLEDRLLNLSL